MNISINTEKLIEIIREDVDANQPHTLVGTSEAYIGELKGCHVTLKVYSADDAEEERITEMTTQNFVIEQSDGVDRVALALRLLELVEGESPKAFDCLKGVMMGEQALKSTHLCYQCDDFHIPDENCELCGGEGEYRELHVIDWTTQKETLSLAFSELLRVARGKISE